MSFVKKGRSTLIVKYLRIEALTIIIANFSISMGSGCA